VAGIGKGKLTLGCKWVPPLVYCIDLIFDLFLSYQIDPFHSANLENFLLNRMNDLQVFLGGGA
jgi:hypothetical protein